MLATGGSASVAADFLIGKGAKDIMMANLIAAPEGVKKMEKEHPDIKIYTAQLDRELNENAYILPGLGDAGDRTFGTL
jgi:uracil phosphoribosyltransferase